MPYVVRKGDTLWGISKSTMGNPRRWREVAAINGMAPPYYLVIGQTLLLPGDAPAARAKQARTATLACFANGSAAGGDDSPPDEAGAGHLPGRGFLFVLSDEILPSGKVVRKVLQQPFFDHAQAIAGNPEVYGISPKNMKSLVSMGEHVLGNTDSRFISVSTRPGGAPNINGRPVYIDLAKAKAAGVTVHETEEIFADLDQMVEADSTLAERVTKLKGVMTEVEGEVLLEGRVPASAVKSARSMMVTRGLRFVQVVGVVVTVYDLGNATVESIHQDSPKPLVKEAARQTGGWAGGWVGMKLGCMAGGALGIETGPGAVISCGVGGLIFGAAGFYGASWLVDYIDSSPGAQQSSAPDYSVPEYGVPNNQANPYSDGGVLTGAGSSLDGGVVGASGSEDY
jgi:hypothetical protein